MARKALKYSLLGLLSILVIGFIVLTLSLDGLVKSNIEEIGSEMTGTAVTVSEVSISPFTGSGIIRGFNVSNPDGFETEDALSIERFDIEIDVWSLFSDNIVIREIIVTAPHLTVEQQIPANNLKTIMDNIQQAIPEGETETNLVISHLVVDEGIVHLRTDVGGTEERTIELPRIEQRDLGTEHHSIRQTVREIAEPVVEQALRAALKGGLDQLQDKARDALRDLFDG